jgi:predicted RNase H-like HicB family nuclease
MEFVRMDTASAKMRHSGYPGWPSGCREVSVIYRVRLQKTEEGYAVWCPALPGCWSQGATEEEALANIKDAIETYLLTVDDLVKDEVTRLVEVPV